MNNTEFDFGSEHTADLEQIGKNLDLHPVDLGTRFINLLVDGIAQFLVGMALGIVIVLIAELIYPPAYFLIDGMNRWQEYLFNFLTGMTYYLILEYATGQTIGKMITKTKVVVESSEKPDFQTILIRSACRYIPFEPFSFFGSKPLGWHDTISKTMVVKVNP